MLRTLDSRAPPAGGSKLAPGALAAVVLAAAIPTVDATGLVVAVPSMARDLEASWLVQQWLLNTATLALAGLLLPAGMAGDRYGRRRVLRVGLVLIVVGAIVGSAAQHLILLLAARAAVGAGGACLLPATIALVRSGTSDSESRTRGFGQLAGWVGFGSGIAPLLAGVLIDVASWRATFALPALLAGAALALSPRLPVDRPGGVPPPGLARGALAGGVALAALTYAAIDGAALGFSAARTGAALAVALVAILIAGAALRSQPEAATLSRNWVAGNAATFTLYFGLIGLTYLLVTYAQVAAGWSATRAAVIVLPATLALWLLSPSLGALAHRCGTRGVMTAAAALSAIGLLWTAGVVDHSWSGWAMAPGTALFGVGLAVGAAPLTHAAVTSVSAERSGLASAMNHAVVRAAGLAATIGLGAVATGGTADFSSAGLRTALLVSAAVVGAGGLALVVLFKDHEAGGVSASGQGAGQESGGAGQVA